MTEEIVVDEYVEPSTELDVYTPPAIANLFGASTPSEVVRRASEHAGALADVIRERHLYKTIGGKNHVFVEGWTLLGAMVGVFPIVVWTRPLEDGWEARVEARTLDGRLVGAAEAECLKTENLWKSRDDYAIRAMAQTRATSRALRGPLGFIVQLAGYNPTAAEEMPGKAETPAPKTKDYEPATAAQKKKLFAVLKELDSKEHLKRADGQTWDDYSKTWSAGRWDVTSRSQLTKGQIATLIDHLENESVPF